MHDQFTGEFVNLGVIVYAPAYSFLDAIFTSKYSRITSMFPDANGKFISKLVRDFEMALNPIKSQLKEIIRPSKDLASITQSLLPNDDSALQLTKVNTAIDLFLDGALQDLYVDMVEKYMANDNSVHSISDSDVWKLKYKKYFDDLKLTEKLQKHVVTTKFDEFAFDKSWKNEIWHCYEPVSFDLINEDNIKDKVYKWKGRISEIDETDEKIHLTFLTQLPHTHTKLKTFITESLNIKTDNVEVELVSENDAPNIAQKVNKLMEEHESH
jgi:hypothetical protein